MVEFALTKEGEDSVDSDGAFPFTNRGDAKKLTKNPSKDLIGLFSS
jgi:hypothetical protein